MAAADRSSDGGRGQPCGIAEVAGPPSLRVRTVERSAVVRIVDAELLFEDGAIRSVRRELRRLIEEEGHTRLIVDLAGVRCLSGDVLAVLAGLKKKVDPVRVRIVLCGLDPLLQDMLRITRLDRVFDICNDEAEALGLGGGSQVGD